MESGHHIRVVRYPVLLEMNGFPPVREQYRNVCRFFLIPMKWGRNIRPHHQVLALLQRVVDTLFQLVFPAALSEAAHIGNIVSFIHD